jgi:Zn-finger nucleic acid-binding protein
MRTVDRQGVHIEQCENCHGIFLDHGELEHMLAAEDRFYGASHYEAYSGATHTSE